MTAKKNNNNVFSLCLSINKKYFWTGVGALGAIGLGFGLWHLFIFAAKSFGVC